MDDEREVVDHSKLVEALLSLLEAALHNLDSAVHVAMLLPDWKQRYEAAQQNLLLRQHSADTFAPLKIAVANALAGQESWTAFDEATQRLNRKPN